MGKIVQNAYEMKESAKNRLKKVEKLEENVEFELNGSFRGAGELKLGPDASKKYAEFESELRL